MKNSKYRADIDGLRAIAIIGVMLFHFFPNVCKAGFIGVDIFFVISGYLISGIIFQGQKEGNFSFLEFYSRRVLRIFPALSLVLISTILISWLVFLPDEYERLGKYTIASVGFFTNIGLWHGVNYFKPTAEPFPFLHLWTLSIEEQFYLFWPVFIFIIWKWFRYFSYIVLFIFIVSFGLNLHWVYDAPNAAFYLPFSRFWELLSGGVLAYLCIDKTSETMKIDKCIDNNLLGLFGFCLLGFSLLMIDDTIFYPGWWALLPMMGTVFIIKAKNDSWLNLNFLSHKWLVFIGLISYPLYLWHWPILVIGRLVGLEEPFWGKLILILASFVLATITYYFLEIPLKRVNFSLHYKAIFLISCMLFIAVIGLGMMTFIYPMNSSPRIQKILSVANEWDFPGRMIPFKVNEDNFYRQGASKKQSILFVGDSNIEQFYPRAEEMQNRKGGSFGLFFATLSGHPPIQNVYNKDHFNHANFLKNVQYFVENDSEITTIVIGGLWYKYFSGELNYYYLGHGVKYPLSIGSKGYQMAMLELQNMLTKLVKLKKVYLIGNIPYDEGLNPKNQITRSIFNKTFLTINEIKGISKRDLENKYGVIGQDLQKIAKNAGAKFISPIDALSNDSICFSVTSDGEAIYKDAAHLRPSFVKFNASFLDETFE